MILKIEPNDYLEKTIIILSEAGLPEVAEKQSAYMRNKFPFFGITSPRSKPLFKQLFKSYGKFTDTELIEFVRLCFENEYREVHYFGILMVEKQIIKQKAYFSDFLEEMIITKSWWDSVDWISKMIGIHFSRFPEQIIPVTRRWMDRGNIWLQRVSIIFQRYKNYPTNEVLLYQYILELKYSQEFFIQKAAGWALRNHSKENPESVRKFIKNNPELSSLTIREAQKYLELYQKKTSF